MVLNKCLLNKPRHGKSASLALNQRSTPHPPSLSFKVTNHTGGWQQPGDLDVPGLILSAFLLPHVLTQNPHPSVPRAEWPVVFREADRQGGALLPHRYIFAVFISPGRGMKKYDFICIYPSGFLGESVWNKEPTSVPYLSFGAFSIEREEEATRKKLRQLFNRSRVGNQAATSQQGGALKTDSLPKQKPIAGSFARLS